MKLKNRKNKKALTGSIITIFVATIMIFVILIVFTYLSYPIRLKIKAGTNLERAGPPFDSEGSDAPYYKEYWKIYNSIKEVSNLKYSLNCKGWFNNEEKNLQEVLVLWSNANTKEIKDFIVNNKCGGGSVAFFNTEISKYILCTTEEFCEIKETAPEAKIMQFKIGEESAGINFDLSPYPVKISASNMGVVDFS